MAMINCPDCGNEVSEAATSCPKCGHPIKKEEKGMGGCGLFMIIVGAIVVAAIIISVGL